MNFIWDAAIRAKRQGQSKANMSYTPADNGSPYYELAFDYLNRKEIGPEPIPVNALYRFSAIFQYLLHPDVRYLLEKDKEEFITKAFDCLLHMLCEVDLHHGITRQECYVRKLRQELLTGVFGKEAVDVVRDLPMERQLAVAGELLHTMQCGSSLQGFSRAFRRLFPQGILYQSRLSPNELDAYLDEPKRQAREHEWQLFCRLFLPLDFSIRVFWQVHFGIIGLDGTMKDKIALF
ncbi:MAG: hypothetical protein K6F01_01485 [Selenomonas sp.]|uniref:hypothetical protein n=1 Tax=Selenomonas sp. TaxID=2053611 RepID=UPI0025F1E61B|nr:hypothetical protein [Selenomonas sp.]MCR5438120.1 hypothetical protein [Selenomonas sp.]